MDNEGLMGMAEREREGRNLFHYPIFCLETLQSFPGVKRPAREADRSSTSSATVKNAWYCVKYRDNFTLHRRALRKWPCSDHEIKSKFEWRVPMWEYETSLFLFLDWGAFAQPCLNPVYVNGMNGHVQTPVLHYVTAWDLFTRYRLCQKKMKRCS
jgi:hypothetical protein